MNTSFYNGISGVKSHQFGIDVWADNIANINTTGFISKTPEFSTIFSTALTNNYYDSTSNDLGLGSRASANALNTSTQGVFTPTDRVFDMAIDGKGWFGVKSVENQTFYTRVGAFSIDKNGDMVDESGNHLLGTLGGNITQTTLSSKIMDAFGNYYGVDNTRELGTAYSISALQDIALDTVNNQSMINLPDILYFPPEATTYVNYQANLNPKVVVGTTEVDLDSLDYPSSATPTSGGTIDISGNIANTSAIQNANYEEDVILVTITDINGKSISTATKMNSTFDWSLNGYDVRNLDLSSDLQISAQIQTTQEIPNVEHFTTEIISPDGAKDFIDMTFTKQVPQQVTQTVWDAQVQILREYEDYKIEAYNPSVTYDPTLYNVNLNTNQVTKIYDPALYKVDTGSNKVYQIIDSQIGSATFASAGELIESTIPALSNSGQTLSLNIGTPYEETPVSVSSTIVSGSDLIISGTASNLSEGDSVNITVTDSLGTIITTSARVLSDGTWSATYTNNPLDTTGTLSTTAYNVISTGYDGMVSHVDLDKARISEKDGYVEGLLKNYGMDSRGNIIAEFDNGRSTPIAKVALYQFQNEQGLANVTSTMFSATANSGDPIFYVNEDGSYRGSTVNSNYLEGSNVSFSTALTELIVMQKAFDASAKSITTSDQLIQNAINMKS